MFHATDTRYNFSELPPQLDPEARSRMEQQAQSVACLVDKSLLIKIGNQHHIGPRAPTLAHKLQSMVEEAMREHSSEEKRPPDREEVRLKYDGRFKDELSVADGTAILIGDQLILTAAHCVCDYISGALKAKKIADYRVVFGFQADHSGQVRTTFDAKDVYRIESVWQHRFTRDKPGEPPIADWAILKLERAVEGRVPLSLTSMQALSLNTPLYMLGHPFGLPLKLTLSGEVQKMSHPHLFEADLDAYAGNSGSPVFAHDTGRMVGMFLRGNGDYDLDGNSIRIRTISKRMIENGEAGYEKCHKIASIEFLKTVLTSSFKMAHSHFSGRIKHLADLKAHLTAPSPSTRVQILYGPSGVGKSELATAFANQNIEAFSFIWTISCGTEEELFNGYQSLAARLAIPLEEKEDLSTLINKVHRKLEQNESKPWLLVFDNLQKIPVLPSRGGSVIITSYRKLGIPRGTVVATEIMPLEPDEALKFLQDVTGKPIGDCKKLLGRIGCYPLLLGQAAAYIKQTGMEIAEYLANFEQSLSLEAAFGLTLKSLSHLAKTWLFLCSRLNPALIPLSYLKAWLDLESCSEEIPAIMEELEAYGLLRYNPKEEMFSLHLEFQRILKALAPNDIAFQVASLLMVVGKGWDFGITNNWLESIHKATIWASHAEPFLTSHQHIPIDALKRASLLHKLGAREFAVIHYEKALAFHSEALELRKAHLSSNHPDIVLSLNSIGGCHYCQGNDDEALEMFKEAYLIQRAALGESHLDVANSLSNIALCYRSQRNYSEAIKMNSEALNIRETALEKNHPDVAMSLNSIGACHFYLGNYTEGLKMCDEALKIYRAAFGQNHPNVANCLNHLGDCHYAQHNYNEALKIFREALDIEQTIFGKNHPSVATSLGNIGNCYASQENYTEAVKMYGEAHLIYKTTQANHPNVVMILGYIEGCKARSKKQSKSGRCVVS
jgi:tetratricopeptide (TPR) repeat protein